ncbi:MAG TPA: hypothetical protein PLO05_06245 [Bacteroidales bacterium]|nr:hypothetical protein [Bacteroidales bacterium]
MKRLDYIFFTILFICLIISSKQKSIAQSTEIDKSEIICIWKNTKHNAFPDLCFYNDNFICSFRESDTHLPEIDSSYGKIIIINSENLKNWKQIKTFESNEFDFRDSKMSIMPNGTLLLLISGIKWEEGKNINQSNFVSFSKDGIEFSDPVEVKIQDEIKTKWDFLGSIVWCDSLGYATLHQRNKPRNTWSVYLLKTYDGIWFDTITQWQIKNKPSEADLKFDTKGNLMAIVRVEPGKNGKFGISEYPFENWKWYDTKTRLGGPELFQINQDTLLVGSRYYNPDIPYHIPIKGREYVGQKTALFLMNKDGTIINTLFLPSYGDSSYPAILKNKNNDLIICYYSSHEKETSIYLFITSISKLINKYFK